jgi:HEAT repeat protein
LGPEIQKDITGPEIKKLSLDQLSDEQLLSLLDDRSMQLEELRNALTEAALRRREVFVGPLLYFLDDPRFIVRVEVVKALSVPYFLEREIVFNKLITLLADEDKLVRGFVAKALARSEHKGVRRILERAKQAEDDEVVIKVINLELAKLDAVNRGQR